MTPSTLDRIFRNPYRFSCRWNEEIFECLKNIGSTLPAASSSSTTSNDFPSTRHRINEDVRPSWTMSYVFTRNGAIAFFEEDIFYAGGGCEGR